MLNLVAMRIGFITQLLWSRYGYFWQQVLTHPDTELRFAQSESLQASLQHPALDNITGIKMRLAAAEALALGDCDLLIAPALNPDAEVARGSGLDPWIASFPDALASSIGGLPPIQAVPASLDEGLEPLAFEVLMQVLRNPVLVRRTLERHRVLLSKKRLPEPRWQRLPDEQETLAILAQPWLLSPKILRHFTPPHHHIISQAQFDPAFLQTESERKTKRLIPTDQEVLGAARFFNRKGSVDKLLFIMDTSSPVDAWLAEQIQQLSYKPLSIETLQNSIPESAESLLTTVHLNSAQ